MTGLSEARHFGALHYSSAGGETATPRAALFVPAASHWSEPAPVAFLALPVVNPPDVS